MRCQSQKATAHCRFCGRDLLGPKQERRLKDTRYFSPHALSASPLSLHPSPPPSICLLFVLFCSGFFCCFFPETVALQTSHFLTSLFSKRGPLILMTMLWAGTTLWRPNGGTRLGPDGERSQEREKGVKLAAKNSGTV